MGEPYRPKHVRGYYCPDCGMGGLTRNSLKTHPGSKRCVKRQNRIKNQAPELGIIGTHNKGDANEEHY